MPFFSFNYKHLYHCCLHKTHIPYQTHSLYFIMKRLLPKWKDPNENQFFSGKKNTNNRFAQNLLFLRIYMFKLGNSSKIYLICNL